MREKERDKLYIIIHVFQRCYILPVIIITIAITRGTPLPAKIDKFSLI